MQKTISVFLSLSLLLPSYVNAALFGLTRPERLTIPARLGFVSDMSPTLKADAKPDVVVILDLHVNRPVQQRISKILSLFARRGWLKGSIGVEGASGYVDLSPAQRMPSAAL